MIAVLEKTKTPHNPNQSSVIGTVDSLSLSRGPKATIMQRKNPPNIAEKLRRYAMYVCLEPNLSPQNA